MEARPGICRILAVGVAFLTGTYTPALAQTGGEAPAVTDDRLALAESLLGREEAASGRTFDRDFRASALTWPADLPLEALVTAESAHDGLGLNVLGNSQADLVYTSLTSCRIVDTRLSGGPLAAGTTLNFLVGSTDLSTQGASPTCCGVPRGPATAAMIYFVAVAPEGQGNLAVTPFGRPMPLGSIINFRAGVNLANGLAVGLCDPLGATCNKDRGDLARSSTIERGGS